LSSDSPALAEARRRGDPYLVYLDGSGRERVLSMSDSWTRVTVGRGVASDVALSWDAAVSTVHATLERLGDDWVLIDEGLSRNGSFVNGQQVSGRRRLMDGDELRFGDTRVGFHAPFQVSNKTEINPVPDV
jgi:pSer/pThr/pTyr-binding forkhead associated (FHA) protein